MKKSWGTLAVFALVPTVALAMSGGDKAEDGLRAQTKLRPASGSSAQGSVTFEEKEDGLHVRAQVTGLSSGYHGFHIHEKGDCSAEDASSAGGHFAPLGHPHAGAESEVRHVGDMGNIFADVNGTATARLVLQKPKGLEDWSQIVGKAVIVHGGKDDLTSQPSGDAGNRIACGVIQRSDESTNVAE